MQATAVTLAWADRGMTLFVVTYSLPLPVALPARRRES